MADVGRKAVPGQDIVPNWTIKLYNWIKTVFPTGM